MKIKSIFRKGFELSVHRKIAMFLIPGVFLYLPLFSQLPSATEIAQYMGPGWNLGNSLEVPGGETGWGNPKVTQVLIDAVYDAGFNTIRIPCSWDSHADQTTLEIDPAWFERVGEVIDYCYANDMFIILNCHWDGGWLENNVTEAMQDSVNRKQHAYWTQAAEYFIDYDECLLFAGANEPDVTNATQMAVLMTYHQTFIDAVRATGGNNSSRVLVIQGPKTDIDKTNQLMTSMPTDEIADRLMLEIHYYTPWNFCGLIEDATWGRMFYFWGKDYHSSTNPTRNANWGEEDAVETYFQSMKTKFVDQGIPVVLGEYSTVKRLSLTGDELELHIASREYYYEYVTNSAIRHGLIPYYWDNGVYGNNTCGIINRDNGAITDEGALAALMKGAYEATSVEEYQEPPVVDSIVQEIAALPNPVIDSTEIQVFLKNAAKVNISVFNILGQKVSSFNEFNMNQGMNRVTWNTGQLPTGTYLINVELGGRVSTKKVLVLR